MNNSIFEPINAILHWLHWPFMVVSTEIKWFFPRENVSKFRIFGNNNKISHFGNMQKEQFEFALLNKKK